MSQNTLFELPPKRRANSKASTPEDDIIMHYVLRRSEREAMHVYEPGPSGKLGGAQTLVNKIIEKMDSHPKTANGRWYVDLDKDEVWTLVRYIQSGGDAGPQNSLRIAFRRYFGDGSGW